MSRRCAIAVVNHSGRPPEWELDRVQAVVDAALAEDGLEHCALAVLLVDDAGSAELHARHFDDPEPTDVMSFPDGSEDPESGRRLLGDLAVGADVARRVAAERGRREADEITLYVLHGVLHLLGYDDEEEDDRAVMWAVQRRILAAVGIALEAEPD
jgi:probable rRNA maturation factor